jgi:hypothetical protein
MTDAHHKTFKDLIEKTEWEKYGHGRDPRCEDCMVHAGYEASAVLGGNKKLGDTWKMLTWTLSGKMGGLKGGKPAKPNGNGHGQTNGHGNVEKGAQPSAVGVASASAGTQEAEVFRIL